MPQAGWSNPWSNQHENGFSRFECGTRDNLGLRLLIIAVFTVIDFVFFLSAMNVGTHLNEYLILEKLISN